MTPLEMQEVLDSIEYPGYDFMVKLKGDVPFLQASFTEPDAYTGELSVQFTRKWLLSEHMVRSEIVQTALKCVLTSAEHRVRETFLYKGERIFGPHFDIEALYEMALHRRLDYRGRKAVSA